HTPRRSSNPDGVMRFEVVARKNHRFGRQAKHRLFVNRVRNEGRWQATKERIILRHGSGMNGHRPNLQSTRGIYHLTAERVRKQLVSIADSEDRYLSAHRLTQPGSQVLAPRSPVADHVMRSGYDNACMFARVRQAFSPRIHYSNSAGAHAQPTGYPIVE